MLALGGSDEGGLPSSCPEHVHNQQLRSVILLTLLCLLTSLIILLHAQLLSLASEKNNKGAIQALCNIFF